MVERGRGLLSPDVTPSRPTHIIEAQQFSRALLEEQLFPLADRMGVVARSRGDNSLDGRRLFNLFYEPSTRTRVSFETAMQLLGGTTSGTENARAFSSAVKGESLEDTIRILNGYGYDVIVLRYDEEGGAKRATVVSQVPIINAGDGPGQHPTQALLDAFTIWKHFGRIDGLNVGMVGDLTYGRTVHSLAYLLAKFEGIHLYFISPRLLKIKEGIKEYLKKHKVDCKEAEDLKKVISDLDVVYMTRAQTERMDIAARSNLKPGSYKLTPQLMISLPKTSIVMHPLPRNEELPAELDDDPRVVIFKQAENGLFVRMALLKMLLTPPHWL